MLKRLLLGILDFCGYFKQDISHYILNDLLLVHRCQLHFLTGCNFSVLFLSLEYTFDSPGWVILSSPNNKSIICGGMVWLGFTRRRKGICFLGLAFSFNNMVLRFIHDIAWNWFICLHCWMTCRRVNESTVIYLAILFSMGIWVVSRFPLRTVQLWTFSSKSLGAHAKVFLYFMRRGDMPDPSFIRVDCVCGHPCHQPAVPSVALWEYAGEPEAPPLLQHLVLSGLLSFALRMV